MGYRRFQHLTCRPLQEREQHGALARHVTCTSLSNDECGAVYQLGFAMLLPGYVFFVVFCIELVLLLQAKMAVTYAAYAAARAAAVYLAATDLSSDSQMGMVHLAAVNAMAPSGCGALSVPGDRLLHYPPQAPWAWAEAYQRCAPGSHSAEFLSRKWQYAARATRIEVTTTSPGDSSGEVQVQLEYEHPFTTSSISRLLGRRCPWLNAPFATITVRATAQMGIENARSEDGGLGIPVHVDYGFRSSNIPLAPPPHRTS